MGPEDIEDWDLSFEDVEIDEEEKHTECDDTTRQPFLKVKTEVE